MTEKAAGKGVAVIGTGGRGEAVTGNLLRDSGQAVRVVSVFDPDEARVKRALDLWKTEAPTICRSYEEAIHMSGVDWVLVFSPNAFHREHIVAAFEAGKDVFSEKPLATSIADCKAIHEAHQRSGRLFMTGFVLRYAPLYRSVKELLDSGTFGRIIGIDANENISPGHGGYIMTNWRRKTSLAGPHILEKCCHDLDLLNWFVGTVPARVAAFGGLSFFKPENKHLEDTYGVERFLAWYDPHRAGTPFENDGDLMDNQVAIFEYRNGVRVQFQATMSNAIPERRMYIACEEGTIIAELYTSTLRYRRLSDEKETVLDFAADGHGGGDDVIMKDLYDVMVNDTPPKSSGEEGLQSTVVALAADQAMREGRVIDLEPTWQSLGR